MSEPSNTERHPNPVDLHVGARIRMRRRILGVSQERLAEDLGIMSQAEMQKLLVAERLTQAGAITSDK